jgi:prepilin-type N-terminal cleavage/methylation domain-containing protein
MNTGRQRANAFTLVEIMIVVGILAVVLAMAMPSFIQTVQKEPLRKAMNDIVEACSQARAKSIIQGVPMEVVIRAADGELTVVPVPTAVPNRTGRQEESGALGAEPVQPGGKMFRAQLDDEIAVTLLYVNLKDRMEEEESRVRFYPNGTSDEFTMVIQRGGSIRKISLECVTGLSRVEVIR